MSILDLGKFLKELFGGLNINIYPIIAENSALMPFATYERSLTLHNHKDQQISTATYSISILSEQYNQSVELLQKLIDACRKIYLFQDTSIRLRIDTTYESYNECYIQTVNLIIEI